MINGGRPILGNPRKPTDIYKSPMLYHGSHMVVKRQSPCSPTFGKFFAKMLVNIPYMENTRVINQAFTTCYNSFRPVTLESLPRARRALEPFRQTPQGDPSVDLGPGDDGGTPKPCGPMDPWPLFEKVLR